MYLIKAKKINEDGSVSLGLSTYRQIKYKAHFVSYKEKLKIWLLPKYLLVLCWHIRRPD